MKYKDPETGEFKEIYVKTADTLPVGTVVDYDGEEIPTGWEPVEDEPSIENGSNYTKIGDTLICYGSVVIPADSDSLTVNLPYPFKEDWGYHVVMTNQLSYSRDTIWSYSAPMKNSFKANTSGNISVEKNATWLAIGKWK